MDAFLLMEPLDLARWRAEALARGRVVAADLESTDEDRMAAGALEDRAQADLAAYQMSFFVTDVLVAWLLVSPLDSAEQDRATKAMGRLVEYASSPRYRDVQALGDALTDALRPVYESPDILVRFSHAGGLPALFNDWATSVAKDGYCKSAVRSLPVNAWEHQTPESLLGVMKGLVDKISDAGEEVVATKLFTGVIYRIYSRYGLEPFERASTISDSCILFYFLHRRISRKPAAYRSHDAIRVLLKKYTNIPEAIRRRHGWGILTVSGRWDCLEYYGCVFANCPERTELLELKVRRQRGVCNPDAEARLYRWGDETRMCSTCKTVSYCSAACQKADRIFHKSQCKAKDDMETDV
ncbi:hypothetical protein PHLGIDRAFT_37226 [Phlebiopsis gigantea 11061_1 CR5-6]|uniref:MYND-type domain-containing protein n=1 Tax=Phlebiopsis gigantea (strain 11061_1 CR5-6) TaxID=745531 RepID=A0A0C3PEK9_PHLG1|nr:hypothetical protein PHLGIDRAFT_37226 [Phlebiopsis gigantea 11061_1 CR5-6]